MKLLESLRKLWQEKPVQKILLPWFVFFVILHLANTQDGGPNAVSRFLTLRAMDEEFSFVIDKRIGATSDWAQTPDGHYYSNKAPGPMLLGYPAFFVIDQIPRLWEKGYRDEHGQRHTPGYFQKTWTCFLNQMLPLGIILGFVLVWFSSLGISATAQTFFVLASLFGSTASMYFNNYSGHGFEAILQLLCLFTLLKGQYRWAGFAAGSALLSDYGFGIQIPAFLLACFLVFQRKREWKKGIVDLSIGAILPAVLWIWYHVACYGSPFLIANHFQNPIFLDTVKEEVNLWGIFRVPNLAAGWELLFGPSRGLLFTQPWLLALLPVGLWRFGNLFFGQNISSQQQSHEQSFYRRVAGIFCLLSLLGLWFMNMSYGGWLGGGAAGPRYMSGVFLCFAFWMALEWDGLASYVKAIFGLGLMTSLVFRALVYSSTILGPGMPLWNWYISELRRPSKTPTLRLCIFALAMALAAFWQWKRSSKNRPL